MTRKMWMGWLLAGLATWFTTPAPGEDPDVEETVYAYGYGETIEEAETMAEDDADSQVDYLVSMYESMGYTKISETVVDEDSDCYTDPGTPGQTYCNAYVEALVVYQGPCCDEIEETVYGYGSGETIEEAETMADDDVDSQIASLDAMYGPMGYTKISETFVDEYSDCYTEPGTPGYTYCDAYLEILVVFAAAPPLTVTITTGPASPVIIGTTVTHSYTSTGTAPFTLQWHRRCGADPTPWIDGGTSAPYQWCADKEGSHQVKLQVTDSTGKTGEKIVTIVVQGPTSIQPTGSVNSTSNGGGPGTPLVVTHKFWPLRGTTKVGACWQDATVYEWIALKTGAGWEAGPPGDVKVWKDTPGQGLEGTTPAAGPGFYWAAPAIMDIKAYVAPATWAAEPVGKVMYEYRQWIAIRVPICGDPANTERFVGSAQFHFKVTKVAPDKVKHVLQP